MHSQQRAILTLGMSWALCLGGCQRSADRIDEVGAERDLSRWLATYGVALAPPTCEWVHDGTRTVRCMTRATRAQIAALVRAAQLSAAVPPPTSSASHPLACRAAAELTSAEYYVSYDGRATGFDYVLVAYAPASSRVCIELEYGWG